MENYAPTGRTRKKPPKEAGGEATICPARSRREGEDKRETELSEDSDGGPCIGAFLPTRATKENCLLSLMLVDTNFKTF